MFSMCPDAAYAGEPPELVRRFLTHYLNEGSVLAFNDRDAFHLRHVAPAAAVRALIGAARPVAARRSWEEPVSAINAYHQAAFHAPLAAGSCQLKARAAAGLIADSGQRSRPILADSARSVATTSTSLRLQEEATVNSALCIRTEIRRTKKTRRTTLAANAFWSLRPSHISAPRRCRCPPDSSLSSFSAVIALDFPTT